MEDIEKNFRLKLNRLRMFVLTVILVFGSINFVGGTQIVYADSEREDWVDRTSAIVTLTDGSALPTDGIVDMATEFKVEYKVKIEDKKLVASTMNPIDVYLLGTLDKNLNDLSLPTKGIPIYSVKGDISSILIGHVKYDSGARNLLFSFADTLPADAKEGMTLDDIEFEYNVSLKQSEIGAEEQTDIIFASSEESKLTLRVKENQPGKPEIEKTSVYDPATKKVKWEVKMTSKGPTYTNPIKIEDVFTEGMLFDADAGVDVKVKDGIYSKIDSAITNEPSNKIGFEYTLPESFATKGETVTFTYQTTMTDKILAGDIAGNGGGGTIDVGNHVYVSDPQGQLGEAHKEEKISTPSKWFEKDAGTIEPDTENNTAIIPWTITIHLNGFYGSMNEIYLHDELDFPLNYVANSAKYEIAGNISSVSGDILDATFVFSASSASAKAKLSDPTGLSLKDLIDSSGIDKPETVTITYNSIINNYSKYLEQNQKQPKNKAWLSYDWKDYNGPGTVPGTSTSVVGPTLEKDSGAVSTMISKTGVPDPSTKRITWTVTFNQNKLSLTNPTIEDIIGPGQHYVLGSCTVTSPALGITVTGPSTTSDPIVFNFDKTPITDKVAFTYQTELNDSEKDIYQNNHNGKEYANTAVLQVDGTEYARTGEDEGKVWYQSNVLNKWSSSYDYMTNEIEWKVTVNKNKMAMTGVSLTDFIQKGTMLVEDSLYYTKDILGVKSPDVEITTSNVGGLYYELTQATDIKDGSFTVYLPNLVVGEYGEITYRTRVNVDSPAFTGAFSQTNVNIDIKNTATLKFDGVVNSPEVEATRSIPPKVVGKSGEIKDKETIAYRIPLNANEAFLPVNYLLRDTLSAGMRYVPSTVHLFTGTVDQNGTITKTSTELEKGVDYQINFSKDVNGNEQMTMNLLKETKKALYLEYWVGIDTSAAGITSFTNTIQAGEGSTPAIESATMARSAVLSSSGSGGLRSGYYFTIKKVDSGDAALFLPGAEFSLYDTTGKDLIATGTTNSNGELKFYGLGKSTNYVLRETKAPTGYIKITVDIPVTTATSGNKDVTVENTQGPSTPEPGPGSPTKPSEKPSTPSTPSTTPKTGEPTKPSSPSLRSRIMVERITPEEVIKEIEELLKKPASPEREEAIKKLHEKIIRLLEEDPNYFEDASDEMKEVIQQLIKNGEIKNGARLPKTGGLVGSAIVVILGASMIGGGIYLSKKNKEDNEEE